MPEIRMRMAMHEEEACFYVLCGDQTGEDRQTGPMKPHLRDGAHTYITFATRQHPHVYKTDLACAAGCVCWLKAGFDVHQLIRLNFSSLTETETRIALISQNSSPLFVGLKVTLYKVLHKNVSSYHGMSEELSDT